jgi:hypothetical protein
MPLVDTVTIATDPCVQQDSQKGLYITWQQFDDKSGTYGLMMATTTVAPQSPWWSKLGLSLNHPIEQLLFLVFGSPLVAIFIVFGNVLASPVAALIVRLGKWLRLPRLLTLLIALIPMIALSLYFLNFISLVLNVEVPQPRVLIGCATAVGVTLYLWYRSRRFPPETLGTIGHLLIASYLSAILLAAPLIYLTTRVQLA